MLIDIILIVQNTIKYNILCPFFLSEAKSDHRRLFKAIDMHYKVILEQKHGFIIS